MPLNLDIIEVVEIIVLSLSSIHIELSIVMNSTTY